METLIAKDKRRQIISLARQHSRSTELVMYRGTYQAMPVLILPLEVPVYRAGNGRLAVLKAEYLRHHANKPDFFENNEETAEVQSALYGMLIELARNPEASIYQELYNTRIQTERLLITHDGIVVDGNRRLASMRTLHGMDADQYAGFTEIEAILLPEDATPIDLELVEADRQLAPNTKLAYGWIDRRLKLRYHKFNLGIEEKLICDTYKLKSLGQLHTELEELELAEQFLEEYLERPHDYLLVEDTELYFIGLHKQLVNIKDELIKQIWKLIGFAMIKEATTLKIEPGNYFPIAPLKYHFALKPVLELYGEQQGLWSSMEELGSGTVINQSMYKQLIQNLNNHDQSRNIAGTIIHLFNQTIVEHEDRPHPISVVAHLNNMSKMLSKIDLDKFTASQRREMFGHLTEVDYHVRTLLKRENQDSNSSLIIISFPGLLRKFTSFCGRGFHWVKRKIFRLESR